MSYFAPGPSPQNYKIIDTDYVTYSVVYACSSLNSYLWLLTREAVIPDSLYTQMLDIAKKNLPRYKFEEMDTREVQGEVCSYKTSV